MGTVADGMERRRVGRMADRRNGRGGVVGSVDEARVMILFLARHEWRVLSASRTGRLVIVVFAFALGIASTIGAMRAANERNTIREFSDRAIAERHTAGDVRADVAANERGVLALLPPARLSGLAVGQGDV